MATPAPVPEALGQLRRLRDELGQRAVAVAYSGGKDSLVCLWLARRVFGRVHAFFYTPVPGLACVERPLRANAASLDIDGEVLVIPQLNDHRAGSYAPRALVAPKLSQSEMYDAARAHFGVEWVVNGWRMADSLTRIAVIKTGGILNKKMHVAMPIARWRDGDVHELLDALPIIEPLHVGDRRTSGFELNAEWLTFLHDHHPGDYALLLKHFPYAEAILARARTHDVGFFSRKRNRKRPANGDEVPAGHSSDDPPT